MKLLVYSLLLYNYTLPNRRRERFCKEENKKRYYLIRTTECQLKKEKEKKSGIKWLLNETKQIKRKSEITQTNKTNKQRKQQNNCAR